MAVKNEERNRMDFIKDTTEYIFLESTPKLSDVIFVPGSSNPLLPRRAAQLYLEGFAKYIIPSGKYSITRGEYLPSLPGTETEGIAYNTECEMYTDILLKSGVPYGAILGEDEAQYTYQNAFFSKKLCDEKGIQVKDAILVCHAFHARRAYTYYKWAFPECDISVCPVVTSDISRDNWYKTEKGRQRIMGELVRLGNQMAEYAEYASSTSL